MKLIEFINFKNDDQRYIRALEKEVIRLTTQCKRWAELQDSPEVVEVKPDKEIKPHFTETWQYTKEQLDMEVMTHLKAKGYEIGDRHHGDMRVVNGIGDIKWIEDTYPTLYFKQMQLAYGRIAARASNRKRRAAAKMENGGGLGWVRTSKSSLGNSIHKTPKS